MKETLRPVFVVFGMLFAAALLAVSVQMTGPATSVSGQSFDEDDCDLSNDELDELDEFDEDEEVDELEEFCDALDEHDEDDCPFDEDELDELDNDELDEAEEDFDGDEFDEDCDFDRDEDDEDDEDEDPRIVVRQVPGPIITAPQIITTAPQPQVVAAAAAPVPAPAPVVAAAPRQVQLPRTGEGPASNPASNSLLPVGAVLVLVAAGGLGYWRFSRAR